jgi:hypothetical protein
MPERAINSRNATGFLLILLPAALAISAVYKAWPYLLAIVLLIVGGKVWENYQWSKMAQSINPVFQRLIVQNRGEITPIDLSLSANVSGQDANRYLATKASEFGTGSRQHPDRGQVYYFVSVSTLGSIFDDSEREVSELAPATNPVVVLPPTPTPATMTTVAVKPESTQQIATEVVELSINPDPLPQTSTSVVQAADPVSSSLRDLLATDPAPIDTPTGIESIPVVESLTNPPTDRPLVTIIQSDLAKRLDVHSSTVYKRRSETNFTEWTRNRDPDGLAWNYNEVTKEYYRIDT